MGTWGAGVFSDDFACDLREAFRAAVADGRTGAEAVEALAASYPRAAGDPGDDEHVVFWAALGLTAWECGRLDDTLKTSALAALERGDLARWNGDRRRAKALADAVARLLSTQPAPVAIKKRRLATCDWTPGQLVGYRTAAGCHAVVQMIKVSRDAGGTYPNLHLLDWYRDRPPSPHDLASLRVRRWSASRAPEAPRAAFMLVGIPQSPARARFEPTDRIREIACFEREAFGTQVLR